MRSWTHAEEEALRYLASRLSGQELAVAFGRTYPALKMKASRIGVAIGDCRVTDLLPTSPAVLRRVVEIVNGQLCPACAKRAIGVKSTGLCGPCHYDHLRQAHEEAIAEREAQRRLWAARSKLHRLRGKEPDEPDLEESLC
ncbi:MAG: hypothetical protein AB7Y46_21080 [Armatimonadota bacterium]